MTSPEEIIEIREALDGIAVCIEGVEEAVRTNSLDLTHIQEAALRIAEALEAQNSMLSKALKLAFDTLDP